MTNKPGKSALKARKRTFRLNNIAKLLGFKTWGKMATAFIALEVNREKADENIDFLKNQLKGMLLRMLELLEAEE